MNYEQEYNKLVNAIKVLQEENPSDEGIQNWVSDNVPELRKSEDEKIREDIIHLVNAHGQGRFRESMLAWLEKQGTSYTKRDIDDAYIKGMSDAKRELEKQGEKKCIDDLTQQEAMDIAVAKCFEQGGQKPVDKVEPKFKYGDRVRNKKSGLEQTLCGCIEDVYKFTFPFRIKDQDDWELVEQKPAECRQETKPNGGIVSEDFNEGDGYYKVNLAYMSKPQVELIEDLVDSWQTAANNSVEWSEEDELHIRELESLIKQVWATAECENDKDTIHKMSDLSFFLKTLKPRLKQEWSEEDEKMVNNILTPLAARYPFDIYQPMYDWLKSLKQRIGG